MRTVPLGVTVTKHFDPTSRDTAAAVGNAGVEAVATVALILWIEATCGELMAPYFEEGEAGVGFRVAVDHIGPAFTGRPVEVHAAVSGAAGRKVTFAVRLEQDGREVMIGEHVRAVVDLARFLGGRAERAGPRENPAADPPLDPPAGVAAGPPVTFFFDVHSPWSYLASTLIGPLARRHGAPIVWRPIHLANLMDRIGGMRRWIRLRPGLRGTGRTLPTGWRGTAWTTIPTPAIRCARRALFELACTRPSRAVPTPSCGL